MANCTSCGVTIGTAPHVCTSAPRSTSAPLYVQVSATPTYGPAVSKRRCPVCGGSGVVEGTPLAFPVPGRCDTPEPAEEQQR